MTPDSPVGYVLTKNLHRRHLTTAQRAEIAVKMLPMLEEETAERRKREFQQRPPGSPANRAAEDARSAKQAATLVGIGRTTVAGLKRLQKEAPELARRVGAGELPVGRAYKVAFLGGSEPTPPKGRSNGKAREHLALFWYSRGQKLAADRSAEEAKRSADASERSADAAQEATGYQRAEVERNRRPGRLVHMQRGNFDPVYRGAGRVVPVASIHAIPRRVRLATVRVPWAVRQPVGLW